MSRRRTRGAVGALVIGLAMGGGAATWERARAADGTTTDSPPATGTSPAATATAERRDLVTREDFDGTLGYTDERTLGSRLRGTLTWAVEEGRVVRPGAVLFRVDTRPVVWFSGGQPAWRTLEDGIDDGLDVRQLEQNLVALGFDPDDEIDVDAEFDDATEEAVERWQKQTGQEQTGSVELGAVVFLPGAARRVASVEAQLGDAVGGPVLATTSTRREASFELDAREAGIVATGESVTVELPDGTSVRGRVRSVGRVASGGGGEEGGDEEPTIEVAVRLPAGKAATAFDQAPVVVRVEAEAERDALAVPVGALLAVAGGGYGLEVVDGGQRRLVRVEVGAFADGYVQVSGDGIAEGTVVVAAEL